MMSIRKCLLVGDGGTGKTSLITRLLTGEFSSAYSATVGYEVHRLTVSPKASSAKVTLHVWDVSGQTSSGPLLEQILSGAHCAIIVFDIASRVTFNNVACWYRDIVRVCGPNVPVTVVGNKIDVPARKIKTEIMCRKFPSSVKVRTNRVVISCVSHKTFHCFFQCFEISVKTNHNVDEPIQWIAEQLLRGSAGDVLIEPPRAGKQLSDENENETVLPDEYIEDKSETNLQGTSRRPRRLQNRNSPQRAGAKQGKKKGRI